MELSVELRPSRNYAYQGYESLDRFGMMKRAFHPSYQLDPFGGHRGHQGAPPPPPPQPNQSHQPRYGQTYNTYQQYTQQGQHHHQEQAARHTFLPKRIFVKLYIKTYLAGKRVS